MINYSAMDNATFLLKKDKNVISVFFDEHDNKIIVGVLQEKYYALNNVKDNKGVSFKVEYRKTVPISPSVGISDRHHPMYDINAETFVSAQGGDRCGVAGQNPNRYFYGTLGYVNHGLGYATDGNVYRCNVGPGFCSNAHVLVRPEGNTIFVGEMHENKIIGTLNCYIPLNDLRINIDFALGNADAFEAGDAAMIRQIGRFNNVNIVIPGQRVRKFGARTGYREGVVLGAANIAVGSGLNRWYYHVWKVTQNFACPGDSGALVINDANEWIGVNSWGDDTDDNCTTRPHAYFWAVHPDSQGFYTDDSGGKKIIITS